MVAFDVSGALRRIRRLADVSQPELAEVCRLSQSAVAQAESGRRGLPVEALARAAALAGLRLALIDAAGDEVAGLSGDAVRDMGGRRFPAHLDTRYGDEEWWHGPERYSREQPSYTLDRLRDTRDHSRGRTGTPDAHQLPQPGDSPRERKEARRRAAGQRREEELERRRRDAPWRRMDAFPCGCPPACGELDDYRGRPVHAPECTCHCDVG